MKWGTRGEKAQGQFTTPHDVAIDTAGNVWVADYGNTRLQRFTTTGGIPADGKKTIITGLDSQPDTLGVDSAGNLFVTEFFANKVRRYDAASGWTSGTVWGGAGTGSGQFNRPHGVAISPDGSVYVGDRDNYRTQRFDTNGKFLNGWGTNGVKPGQFRQAVGTAVDVDCNVWVADSDAHRLQKFNSAGKLLDQIPNVHAVDVAIGPNRDIYTLENPGVDQRIERFHELPGAKPANAPKVLQLAYDKKTKTFRVSVPYTPDNVTCPSELAATASLKTVGGPDARDESRPPAPGQPARDDRHPGGEGRHSARGVQDRRRLEGRQDTAQRHSEDERRQHAHDQGRDASHPDRLHQVGCAARASGAAQVAMPSFLVETYTPGPGRTALPGLAAQAEEAASVASIAGIDIQHVRSFLAPG